MLLRAYRDARDLQKMCALLSAGYLAQTDTYYPHPGDLKWWLFNALSSHHPWQNIFLWDDPLDEGRLLGWVLLATPWSGMEVFVQPELADSPWVGELNGWAEEKLTEDAHRRNRSTLLRMNVAETDGVLQNHLRSRGFTLLEGEALLVMKGSLTHELALPSLPDSGYCLRAVGAGELEARAAAQRAAFQSGMAWPEYLARYRNFFASPGYPAGCDWVVVAPDGQVASFCMVWMDAFSSSVQVEPVGTAPDFQRRGLGKAVLLAGLRQAQALGMRTMRICARADNPPAIRLYESVGFQVVNRWLTYQKQLAAAETGL